MSLLTAALAVVFVASAAAQAYQTETFGVKDGVNVEVKTAGGSIVVNGTRSDEVKVEMIVKRRGRTIDPGEADLKDWDITIEKRGNTVYAIAERDGRINWGNNNYSISFVVSTPRDARADVKTSGGSIEIANLMGDQSANTSGGSITATEIGGDIDLRTSGGSITIEAIEGSVVANTSGGRIRANHINGGIIAKTSGGSITLNEVSGNVEAKTSGGSIDAEIVSPQDYIDLRTSGGSITVTVPKNNGYDLDLDGNRVRADLVNFKGDMEKDTMRGTMNGGGTKVSARTSGGSVSLRYL